MSNIISKIILGFLFFCFFLILSFYTFFSGDKKDELVSPEFNITEIGKESLSGAVLDKISFYTTIYSKNKDYKIEKNNIILGNGVYFIDSRDIFSKIFIKMGTNNILLKGGGMVYINNNPEYKTIVSLNNKIEINFNNIDQNKKGVKIFLYPHMYFSFSKYRYKYENGKKIKDINDLFVLEEADSLRVAQLGTLNYFNQNFLDILDNEKSIFIKDENLNFFKIVLSDLMRKQKRYSKDLNKIKRYNFSNIDSIDYIEKYFVFFYNDRKKTIYYKNKTLLLLIKLLNNGNENDISKIVKNVDIIKNLDNKEFLEIKEIIKKIFFLVLYDLSEKSDVIQNNYDDLILKIFNIKDSVKIKLIKEVDRYNYLGDFSKYLNLLILNVEDKDLESLDKEYYSLFKQNILVKNFSNFNLDQIYYDILLKGFILYSKNIEKNFNSEEEDKFKVNVIYNIDLLEQVSLSLRKRYFEEKRNNQNLLVLKNDIQIKDIKGLKYAIDEIFKKYFKIKKILEKNYSKNVTYIVKYKNLKNELREYTDALNNYIYYKKEYSKINRALLGVDVFKDVNEEISKEKFMNFIREFSYINFDTIELEIKDDFYIVKNIEINFRKFSFELYPKFGNLIKNIKIKNKNNLTSKEKSFYNFLESTSYTLDLERKKYNKFYSKVKDEEKERYNFKNFFNNIFFIRNKEDKKNYIRNQNQNQNNDDDVVQTFKRAKLLGSKGEFRNIQKILNIKYSNLDIEKKDGDKFSIKIKNSYLILFDGKEKYGADFNSFYRLDSGKHYFYGIEIKPNINGKILFNGLKFKIKGKINLVSFESDMKKIFSKMGDIDKDFRKVNKEKRINEVEYNFVTGKYYFK